MSGKKTPPGDLGNVISLDHVNFRVSDQRLATLFYLEGLGLTRDPYRMTGTGNMWVNIGAQQFHLPTTEPTPFPGVVGLAVPSLDAVRKRLKQVAPKLKGTDVTWKDGKTAIATTDPWGRRIRLHPAGRLPTLMNLALVYVELWAPKGSAAAIGQFYEQVLEVPVQRNGGAVSVTMGPHQTMRFVESPEAPGDAHNNHVAVYLTRYRRVYARMSELRILMEKDRYEQFRFNCILNLKTGNSVMKFEHEMRSLYHGDYGRPLVNRGDIGGRLGRVIGRET